MNIELNINQNSTKKELKRIEIQIKLEREGKKLSAQTNHKWLFESLRFITSSRIFEKLKKYQRLTSSTIPLQIRRDQGSADSS